MKVVVDANIVFSAILNTNSRIADLLMNSKGTFEFFAPDFLQTELKKYHSKISSITKMPLTEIRTVENRVTKPITFISGALVPSDKWIQAEKLAGDIDDKDIPYVALALFCRCKLWTGDKVLKKGLESKNLKSVVCTEDLFDLRELKKR